MTYQLDEILKEQALKRKEIALMRANEALEMMRKKGIVVQLFGSILTDDFRNHSDVDFLITECPYDQRYVIESYVENIMKDIPFDVAYFDELSEEFKNRLYELGVVLKPHS